MGVYTGTLDPPQGGGYAPGSGNKTPQQWSNDEERIRTAITQSQGWEQQKLEAQLKDAGDARENAMKIAALNNETSRYGTDAQKETAMAQLKENARQFEMNHALDIAKTATEYLSTPDRYFQASDFLSMTNRAAQGAGPQPYGANGMPRPKTMDDFNTLYTGGGSPDGAPAAVPSGGGGIYGGGAAPAGQPASGGGGSAQADPRQAAVSAVFKNLPPSEGEGLDNMDYAALSAAQAIYNSNLRPGTLQRMRPGQRDMLDSAGKRLGIYTPDWRSQQMRNSPGQQSVRAA